MNNFRNFIDSNRYNHSNNELPKPPATLRNFQQLFSDNSSASCYSTNNPSENKSSRNHTNNQFLRQTYDAGSDNNFNRDLRAYNKEAKSNKFLRSTINGNIDDFVPKKQKLIGPHVNRYTTKTTTSQGISPTQNTAPSLRLDYKVGQHIPSFQSQQRRQKYDQLSTKLEKSAQIINELKKLKDQRKLRKNSNRNIQELRSLQIKKQSDSRQKRDIKFTKKNYIQYYTPKQDKAAYQERFGKKDYHLGGRSRSKTPVKIDKSQIPTFAKNIIESRQMAESSQNKLSLSKSGIKERKSSQKTDPGLYSSPKADNKAPRSVIAEKNHRFSIGEFTLGKSLGEGKFGNVHSATHISTGSLFAIKKIPKQMIKSHSMVDQFLKQVKLQSFMNHQNVLTIYGLCDDTEHLYLILEYMQEGTLFKLLKSKKVLQEQEAAQYLKQVAKAVRYIHQNGIAHRDIKPQNIVMTNGICKLCDFGWATVCNERRKTYCGTFDYAAPEILQGTQYDMSVDLWCLGVLAYELMVGKAPFYHTSRKQTMKRILNVDSFTITYPQSLSKKAISFIEALIKKNPQERMRSDSLLSHPFLKDVSSDII